MSASAGRGVRVGIDASNLRFGGGRTHLLELLRAADPARDGFSEIFVWGAPDTVALLPRRSWLLASAEPMLAGSLPARAAWLKMALPRRARAVDVVFAPGGLVIPLDRPTVTMCQNLLMFDADERRRYGVSRSRARLEVLRVTQRRSYRRSAGVIMLSEWSQRVVEADLGEWHRRTRVIPHGVGASFFAAPRRQRPLREISAARPFRFTYVSAISPYKNHPQLIEAFATVSRQIDAELVLIGPQGTKAARQGLERAVDRTGTRSKVRWLGPIRYDEMRAHLLGSDAVVYPSSCETFGIALLEAMAAGLPVASAHSTSLPEVLADAGVYFDPQSPADIASALVRLAENEQLRSNLAAQAHARAAEFTWSRCAQATFEFIRTTRG